MFIAVLLVNLKVNSYVQIIRMVVPYWDIITHGMHCPHQRKVVQGLGTKICHFLGTNSVNFSAIS